LTLGGRLRFVIDLASWSGYLNWHGDFKNAPPRFGGGDLIHETDDPVGLASRIWRFPGTRRRVRCRRPGGDIAVPATKAVSWIRRAANFGETKPVIFVPGNHEFYADVLSSGLANMRVAAAGTNVHALDCDEAMIGGVRFLGCTLWTDFALRIDTADGLQIDVERAITESGAVMSDELPKGTT
jgi:hypothetical protein